MGTERIPVTGERDGADFANAMFCAQVKLRRGQPDYLRDWLDGIVQAAQASNRVGFVIWKQPGKRDDDALVVLRLKDWCDLHGACETGEEQ